METSGFLSKESLPWKKRQCHRTKRLAFLGGATGKEHACQSRRHKRCGFDFWVEKIPWRRKWQSTPEFLPRKSHGQRSLAGYSPWGHKESDTTDATWHTSTHQDSIQSLSCVQLFVTPWTAARQASLSFTNSQSLLKILSIKSVMPSNHLILCCPLLLPPSIFPSIRVFYNESVLHIKLPKYWNFSISLSNEYSRLISFRIDWLDLLAVQGTLKSLLQHHSSKVSILHHSAFFIVQLSHPYMTTGKTVALTFGPYGPLSAK